MDEASKVARMDLRDNLISQDEGLHGTIEKNEANWCSRVQTHINMMYRLGGEHLNDIPRYIHLLQRKNCPKWQEDKAYAVKNGYLPNTELAKSDEMKKQTDQQIEELTKKFNAAVNDKNYEEVSRIYEVIYGLMVKHLQKNPHDAEEYQVTIMKLYKSWTDRKEQDAGQTAEQEGAGNKRKKRKSKQHSKKSRKTKSKKSRKTKSRRH